MGPIVKWGVVIGTCVLLAVALGLPSAAWQTVDGSTQQNVAEQILDEPRFGETRPGLWDRFAEWWDDTFQPDDGQAPANDPSGGSGATDGSGASGNEAQEAPPAGGESSSEPADGSNPPADGAAGANPPPGASRGLASLGLGLQVMLGLGVLILVALGARWLIGRRTVRATPGEVGPDHAAQSLDPAVLFEEAEAAATRGDYAAAIRLRFRAGIARLTTSGTITGGEVTTNAGIADELRLAEFDQLSATFERIIYGGHPAAKRHDEESRATWPTVIERAGL